MKLRFLTIFFVLLLLLLGGNALADSSRKVLKQPKPMYPPLARQMNLHGAVTIELTISPAGKVTQAKAVGGSPVLIQAAVDAVKAWTFEPAGETTTEVVKINFE